MSAVRQIRARAKPKRSAEDLAHDALERSVLKLLTVTGKLTRRLRAISNARELTWSQVAIMARLERTGPMTPADLARAEAVKPQSMSGTLENMEAEGLVERKPD